MPFCSNGGGENPARLSKFRTLQFGSQILQKARLLQTIRHFLDCKGFIEVDTQVLQTALVPELHVHSFYLHQCKRYLLPSPELAMKQLLCQWHLEGEARSIYQLAHCFRQEEQQDDLHSWEFQMLELYMLDYSTAQLLDLVNELLQVFGAQLRFNLGSGLAGMRPVVLSFDALCRRALGLEFDRYWHNGLSGMQDLYRRAGGKVSEQLNLDDLFHLFLVEFLEPYIAEELPYCVLYPYPDATPLPAWCLQEGWIDRWELYINGMELANACREENRPEYLRRYRYRFAQALAACQTTTAKQWDWDALDLWQNLPNCSGVALGIDRLLVLTI